MIQRAVCLLTNTRDLAADEVVHRLDELGNPVVRLNADRPRTLPTWTLDQGLDLEVGTVWWRQFELDSDSPGDPAEIDDLLVCRSQWRSWLSVLDPGNIPWVNQPWSARRAENKVEQLRMAKACKFRIPETVITNSAAEAAAFRKGQEVVIKSLASGYFEFSGQGFVYTHLLSDAILAQDESDWLAQPVIVQRKVDGQDIRVIAFGDECFGAVCDAASLDWRLDGASIKWKPYEVPRSLRRMCREYLRHMTLRYAAFDFIDDSETVWFLEANQAGEWVFLERGLRLGMSDAFATFLCYLASRS